MSYETDLPNQPQQLTVKEAIEQGYTHFGFSTGDFQHLSTIEDAEAGDFLPNEYRGGHAVLAEKQPYYLNIDGDAIRDTLTDQICDSDTYMDDAGTIEDALKEMEGWNEFAAKINDTLKKHPYWILTDIKLIPNDPQ